MKSIAYIALALFAAVALLSAAFGLTWLGIEWRGFFGPKRAAVEREVFMQTRSYESGMLQQLARYRLEHARAETPAEKSAIASTVRQQFAEFDPERIGDADLRQFLTEMK